MYDVSFQMTLAVFKGHKRVGQVKLEVAFVAVADFLVFVVIVVVVVVVVAFVVVVVLLLLLFVLLCFAPI